MVTVRWSAAMLTLLCVVLAFTVTHNRDGLLVLAVVFLAAFTWSVDGFKWSTWCADAETSERLASVDEQLDFEEAVLGDLSRLNPQGDPRR